MLGFSGALVALTPSDVTLPLNVGRLLAVVAAGLALWAFWPRKYQVTNLRVLRARYLMAEEVFTRRTMLDTHIEMSETTMEVLKSKARRLKAAMVALAAAATLAAGGLAVG